jgi:hypothetical protein
VVVIWYITHAASVFKCLRDGVFFLCEGQVSLLGRVCGGFKINASRSSTSLSALAVLAFVVFNYYNKNTYDHRFVLIL